MSTLRETIMDAQECFLEEVASHSIFHNERGKYSHYDFFFSDKKASNKRSGRTRVATQTFLFSRIAMGTPTRSCVLGTVLVIFKILT